MRRGPAILLLFLFSFPLIGPALFVDAGSDLPACCRRDGKHHCGMMAQDMAETPSSGPVVSTFRTRCPFFPKGGAILPQSGPALLAATQPLCGALLCDMTVQAQAEAGYCVSLQCSHQKRGPPTFLS